MLARSAANGLNPRAQIQPATTAAIGQPSLSKLPMTTIDQWSHLTVTYGF
jgi:hypothetical protein